MSNSSEIILHEEGYLPPSSRFAKMNAKIVQETKLFYLMTGETVMELFTLIESSLDEIIKDENDDHESLIVSQNLEKLVNRFYFRDILEIIKTPQIIEFRNKLRTLVEKLDYVRFHIHDVFHSRFSFDKLFIACKTAVLNNILSKLCEYESIATDVYERHNVGESFARSYRMTGHYIEMLYFSSDSVGYTELGHHPLHTIETNNYKISLSYFQLKLHYRQYHNISVVTVDAPLELPKDGQNSPLSFLLCKSDDSFFETILDGFAKNIRENDQPLNSTNLDYIFTFMKFCLEYLIVNRSQVPVLARFEVILYSLSTYTLLKDYDTLVLGSHLKDMVRICKRIPWKHVRVEDVAEFLVPIRRLEILRLRMRNRGYAPHQLHDYEFSNTFERSCLLADDITDKEAWENKVRSYPNLDDIRAAGTETSCMICLEPLAEVPDVAIMPTCVHLLCLKCMETNCSPRNDITT